jgi:hypothetical protein
MATRANQTSPAVRAGIDARISWDPGGQRAGVERITPRRVVEKGSPAR